LERLGLDDDLAGLPVGQRHVRRVAAHSRAGERLDERRARAVEELDHLQAEPGRGFAVEIELDDVLGRRGRMDAVDGAGAFELGDDEAAVLLPEERVLAAEAVVVAAGPVVARGEADLDRPLEARQEVEAGQLFDADRGGTLRGGGRRRIPLGARSEKGDGAERQRQDRVFPHRRPPRPGACRPQIVSPMNHNLGPPVKPERS
jgi:hypothetical protein